MDQIGKYEILDKIGTGGFAVVYKGYDPYIKRAVAIKVCYLRDEETRERFKREAEVAGRLHHRHITTIYDFGMHEGMPYLVEEYLPGEDLAQLIRRREPETPEEKIEFLMQIASGLAHAHSRGVIHRDIKPSNIRVLENGKVKIMDFGTAKIADTESKLTQTGMTLGTVAYLSPERLLGQPCRTNSDIFSFGVLAYELLAFRRPFEGRNIPNLIDQVLNAAPAQLTERWPECPPRLAEIVHRCLHKDPEQRYAAFNEVMQDLEDVRVGGNAGEPISFHESSTSVVVPPKVFQASSMLQRARQHFAAGKYERAKVLLDEVLELDPRNAKALQLQRECHEATGEALTGSRTRAPGPQPEAITPQGTFSAPTSANLESRESRRLRKIAEAIASIEGYLEEHEVGKAAAALKFATQLFGRFEQAAVLRERLVQEIRNAVAEVREAGLAQARVLVDALGTLHTRGILEVGDAEALACRVEELDPQNRAARHYVEALNTTEPGSMDAQRAKRLADAVASIERMIAQGEPEMAEQALRFAIHLHGNLEELDVLQARIADAHRLHNTAS